LEEQRSGSISSDVVANVERLNKILGNVV